MTATPERGPRWLEYVPLNELRPDPRNPIRLDLIPRDVLARRFDEKTTRLEPDECWPWGGTITDQGYGQLVVNRVCIRANRVAHYLATGEQPQNVCHRCDNPPCVNPAHLFGGTLGDNQRDKGRKGRAARGEKNGGGKKLTEAQVREIRGLLATGLLTKRAIGEQYGVSATEIGFIHRGEQWSHVV